MSEIQSAAAQAAEPAPLPLVDRLIITRINQAFDCDAFFPALDPLLWQETAREDHRSETSGLDYAFVTYERR